MALMGRPALGLAVRPLSRWNIRQARQASAPANGAASMSRPAAIRDGSRLATSSRRAGTFPSHSWSGSR